MGTTIASHFNVASERTLHKLLRQAGLTRSSRIVNLPHFFRNQTFIPTTKLCLRELAHRAANSPFFFAADRP